ncbi:MAG: ribulose-phosphate 3-epimerase [Treponema sp.]|nr:ribulose-phosphate 3-epimerase [Treponema sp.]
MSDKILAPSLLSADFGDLAASVKKIQEGGAGVVHIDVMDGAFVPEVSFGQVVVRSIRPLTTLPFDVHLMVQNPERQIESFAKAGADWITFHQEAACGNEAQLLQKIRSLGKKAGISVKPATSIETLKNSLKFADIILIMSVEPGFGGQKLIPQCLDKIRELAALRSELGLNYKISVDGGVNAQTLDSVLQSGVDIVVSGSAFFNGSLGWRN